MSTNVHRFLSSVGAYTLDKDTISCYEKYSVENESEKPPYRRKRIGWNAAAFSFILGILGTKMFLYTPFAEVGAMPLRQWTANPQKNYTELKIRMDYTIPDLEPERLIEGEPIDFHFSPGTTAETEPSEFVVIEFFVSGGSVTQVRKIRGSTHSDADLYVRNLIYGWRFFGNRRGWVRLKINWATKAIYVDVNDFSGTSPLPQNASDLIRSINNNEAAKYEKW